MALALQRLHWDSRFLGYNVGRIDMLVYDEIALETLLRKARQEDYKLLYVFTNSDTVLSSNLANATTSYPVDTKRTYCFGLGQVETGKDVDSIKEFSTEHDVAQLYELAYQSGEYSRFKVDATFGQENFKRLYRQWIDNSLSGKAADATFIYVANETILGFITVKTQDMVSTIGLMATDKSVRGQGIGSALLNYVKQDLRSTSATRLDVATQKKNIPACRFYEQNGFVLKNEVNVYHLWP